MYYLIFHLDERFAHYRDLRDAVQQHNAVVCACILLAYKETLQAGGAVDVQVSNLSVKIIKCNAMCM